MSYTLKKEERLSKKKLISEVFDKGHSCVNYPLKIYWATQKANNEIPGRIMVAVSKKKIKKAVQRNKLKRYLREAYRKNKSIIKNREILYNMVILYIGADDNDYRAIESKLIILLHEIVKDK